MSTCRSSPVAVLATQIGSTPERADDSETADLLAASAGHGAGGSGVRGTARPGPLLHSDRRMGTRSARDGPGVFGLAAQLQRLCGVRLLRGDGGNFSGHRGWLCGIARPSRW